jgi:hypothetical protein
VHKGRVFALFAYFDAGRFGQRLEGFRSFVFPESTAIKVYSHLDAAIRRPCESLNDGPVRQDISGKIDFTLRRIDQLNVDMFEMFGWRIVYDWGRIGIRAGVWGSSGPDLRPGVFATAFATKRNATVW